MSVSEKQVYNFIKSCGNRGTWLKDIKLKSGLHQQVVNQAIKSLERLNYIKSIKSVKNPTKKLFILAELEPSVELTGGTWYTDDVLDVEFIDQLCAQLSKFIHSKVLMLI
jgi:DNA-directed RNA polymerase III subunit RPC6